MLCFLQTPHFGAIVSPHPQEKELEQSILAGLPPVILVTASVNAFIRMPGAGGKAAAELVSWQSSLLQLLSDYASSDYFFITAFIPLTAAYSRIPRPISCPAEWPRVREAGFPLGWGPCRRDPESP